MKTFAKNDFYFQLTIFVIISVIVLISFLLRSEKLILIYLFYFGVGISQLVSYLIRCSYNYKKSLIFKIYGCLIFPVFLSLILLVISASFDDLAEIFMIIPMLSLYYSPVLAILYLIDCYNFYKSQKQKP